MHWSDLLVDEKGTLSWRKILTLVAGLLFLSGCIIFWLGGQALPTEYIMIISGVFAFYFLKNRMNGQAPWTGFQQKPPQYQPQNGDNGNGNGDGNGNGNDSGKPDISGP